jgi:hypothetical protein
LIIFDTVDRSILRSNFFETQSTKSDCLRDLLYILNVRKARSSDLDLKTYFFYFFTHINKNVKLHN